VLRYGKKVVVTKIVNLLSKFESGSLEGINVMLKHIVKLIGFVKRNALIKPDPILLGFTTHRDFKKRLL